MPRMTLIGYRGSGKSSVAARLADQLGCSWCDADDVLEQKAGTTITELITTRGEPAFRDLETDLLRQLLATESGVLATGGGVVLREENRRLLQNLGQPVIWLTAPAAVLRDRLAADPATVLRRPALSGGNVLDEVAATILARAPLYQATANAVIDVYTAPVAEVVARIIRWRTGLEDRSPDAEPPRPESIP